MSESGICWQQRRRPKRALLVAGSVIALLLGLGGAWLFQALMLHPSWYWASGVGIILFFSTFALLASGARVALTTTGMLQYGYGNRIDLEMPLQAVTAWTHFNSGLLRGVGCAIDPELVRCHTRKVAGKGRMAQWRRELGIDVLLEHLAAEDISELQRLAADLPKTTKQHPPSA